MLFTTPGIENYLGGVILFDETVNTRASKNSSKVQRGLFPELKLIED